MRRSLAGLGAAALIGGALAAPGAATAACDAYFLSFCDEQAFCVRVDTAASSGSTDDPFDELLEDDAAVSLTQSASDSTTANAMATTTASASTGALSIVSMASVSGASQALGSSASASPFALLRLDDLVFSGPTGSVQTRLMLEIDGALAAAASRANDHTQATAQAKIELNGNVCEASGASLLTFFGQRTINVRHVDDDPAPVADEIPSSGILETIPLVGSATLVTDPFTVPTGQPLQLELWMTQNTVAILSKQGGPGDDPAGSASGVADFGSTLRFPATGPVFALPPGYTADSALGGIADNRAPEPGAPALGAAALGALASLWGVRRRAGTFRPRPTRRAEARRDDLLAP